MIVEVTVRAGAKRNTLSIESDGTIKIHTTTIPEKGKANKVVRDMLAKHFNVAKSLVTLVRGNTSSKKTFQIED